MATAIGQHYINGRDLWTTYGIIVSEGSNQFLEFPKRKDSITHDWGDADGVDVDLSSPKFQSRDIQLKCGVIADNASDFWAKRKAFFDVLRQPGTFRFTVAAFEKDFYCFYVDCSSFDRYTRLDNGKVACKFTMTITEQQPEIATDSGTSDYIITEEGDFLIS